MSTFDLFTPKISTFNMWLNNNLLQNYLHFLGAETCSQEKESAAYPGKSSRVC